MSNKKTRNIDKRIRKAKEETKAEQIRLKNKSDFWFELYHNQKVLNYKRENIIMKLLSIIMQVDIVINENCKLEKMQNVKKVFDKIKKITNRKNVGAVWAE